MGSVLDEVRLEGVLTEVGWCDKNSLQDPPGGEKFVFLTETNLLLIA